MGQTRRYRRIVKRIAMLYGSSPGAHRPVFPGKLPDRSGELHMGRRCREISGISEIYWGEMTGIVNPDRMHIESVRPVRL